MEEKVLKIISELLTLSAGELEEGLDRTDIWDSLRRVEVLFAVEEELGVQFDEEELAELDTPRKLCAAAFRKVE